MPAQSPSSPANRLRSGSEFEDGESIVVNIEVGQHEHFVARMFIEEVQRRQDLNLQLAEIDQRVEQRRQLILEFEYVLTFFRKSALYEEVKHCLERQYQMLEDLLFIQELRRVIFAIARDISTDISMIDLIRA